MIQDHTDAAVLPASLTGIASVVGTSAAMELSRRFGGRRLYFPVHLPAQHPLIDAVGRDAAQALSATYGGERMSIPACRGADGGRDDEIRERRRAGATVSDLAAEFRLTERWIWSILSRG